MLAGLASFSFAAGSQASATLPFDDGEGNSVTYNDGDECDTQPLMGSSVGPVR